MPDVKITEQQKELAIKAGAGLATLVLCYMVMIGPVFRDIAFLQQSILNSQKRTELYREIQDMSASLNSKENMLAANAERSQILGKISDIVGRNQIRVQNLTPKTEPAGEYIKLRIEMDGQGSFFSLIKSLKEVEKNEPSIKIRDVSILWKPFPKAQEAKYLLQIHLVFETFLKQRAQKNV